MATPPRYDEIFFQGLQEIFPTQGITMARQDIDLYFLDIAKVVGTRGTCDRGRMGCVLVKDKRILSTGYVGSPAGAAHCDDVGHEMVTMVDDSGKESKHCVRTAHAEMNALSNAARYGVSTDGATCYGLFEPCYTCAKQLINAGIVRVVCLRRYHAAEKSRRLFKEVGVELVVIFDETETYDNM